jgi:hypothetical protein
MIVSRAIGRLSGLAVADDQLALDAADRDHRVDGFDTGLERLFHGGSIDDAGRDALDRHEVSRLDRALAVQGLAERVHDASDEPFARGKPA